jgi:hypothetical protein
MNIYQGFILRKFFTTAYSYSKNHFIYLLLFRERAFGLHWALWLLGSWALCSWVLGLMDPWALGPLGSWALGPLGSWALGLLISIDPLGTWLLGPWGLKSLGSWALGLFFKDDSFTFFQLDWVVVDFRLVYRGFKMRKCFLLLHCIRETHFILTLI